MNILAEDTRATVALILGVMALGLSSVLFTILAFAALLKKMTGRENAITRWMDR